MPKFPFTNYHELNLDWILKKVTALFDASEENAATIRTYNARLTNAEQTATNAETAATAAQQLADAASSNADSALSVAGTADAKADSALTAATNAAGAAAGAMTTAQEARQIAANAQSAAADAGALANDASNAAAAAQQTADTNAGNIATLQTAVDNISGEVSDIDNKADVIISSASGNIASFADGADDMQIRSLVVNIEPAQSGSGDPSPTNVRPITGRTGCSVVRTDGAEESQTITISWQSAAGTVYGGTIDIISGLLTVKSAFKQYTGEATERWALSSSWNKENTIVAYSNVDITDAYVPQGSNYMFITNCNFLPLKLYQELRNEDSIGITVTGGAKPTIRILKTIATTISELQTYLASNHLQIVYELLTPVVYQLTPQQINTLLGTNNIYSDAGSIADVRYPADTKLYIDGKIAELQALVLEN